MLNVCIGLLYYAILVESAMSILHVALMSLDG